MVQPLNIETTAHGCVGMAHNFAHHLVVHGLHGQHLSYQVQENLSCMCGIPH
jgi:hypothetical protein